MFNYSNQHVNIIMRVHLTNGTSQRSRSIASSVSLSRSVEFAAWVVRSPCHSDVALKL